MVRWLVRRAHAAADAVVARRLLRDGRRDALARRRAARQTGHADPHRSALMNRGIAPNEMDYVTPDVMLK